MCCVWCSQLQMYVYGLFVSTCVVRRYADCGDLYLSLSSFFKKRASKQSHISM